MIDKEFVPYNLAKQVKQLGFKQECFGYYIDVEVSNPFLVKNIISDDQGGYFTLAPLWQQAFSFLLKKLKDYRISYWDDDSGHISYSGISDWEETFDSREECLKKLIELCKNQ